ncbi:MAG: hypothetical protein O7G88_04535 [bacterium]|nr:hypothetical protein [bacterium]
MRCATLVLSAGLVFILLLPGYGNSGEIKLDAAARPSCIDTNNKVICLHYFEQEKVLLEKLLDGLCDDLRVRLIQLGSRLYAEVGDPLMLPAGFCQNTKRVYMKLPRVKRTVAFDLQIFTKKQDQSWGKVKSLPILVYPKDLLQPLKNWAKKNLLLVKGKSEKLISFLDSENISYATRNIYSDGDKVILHVGDLKEDNPDYRYANSSIIVFREVVVDLPQIRALSTRYGPRIFVEMKLLDSLSDSPLVQKSFMKIFKMAVDLNHHVGG